MKATRALHPNDFLAAVGVACLVVLTYGLKATDLLRAVPGDLGDARFNSIVLEHVYLWLTGREANLWSPRFFYPFEGVLAFSDNHFGSILPYALARMAGGSREIAFNAWFLTGLASNGFVAYLVSRRLGLTPVGSVICGMVFSMSLPVVAQDGHAQLTYRFATPLAYLAYVQLRQRPGVDHLAWLVCWWALQFFFSIYIGIFLTLLLAALVAVEWRTPQFRDLLHALKVEQPFRIGRSSSSRTVLSVVAVTLFALLGWMLMEYSSTARMYQFQRAHSEISSMLPRPGSYLLADRSALSGWVGQWIEGIPMRHEHQAFVGLGVLILMILGWQKRPNHTDFPWLRPLCLASMALVLLTLSIGPVSLYKILMGLPGINSVRAVSRIILIFLWPAGLLAGLGAMRALQWAGSTVPTRAVMTLGLLLLCSVETMTAQVSNEPISRWQDRQVALARQSVMPLPAGAVIVNYLQPDADWVQSELDAVIFAQDRGLATVNGYSGNTPPAYVQMLPCLAMDYRLVQFVRFKDLPASHIEPDRRRLFALNASPCPDGLLRTRPGPLGKDVPPTIELTIQDVQMKQGQLTATVSITNRGVNELRTLSESGHPVKLGWRVLRPDDTKARWNQRKFLALNIPPGQSRQVDLDTVLPPDCQRCQLEVSLVQEGIYWFHEEGMKTARLLLKTGQ